MGTRIYLLMLALVLAWSCAGGGGNSAWASPHDADDSTSEAEASGADEVSATQGIIDFARDVNPILVDKCLGCHGPEDAKNDFRVDIPTSLLDYIEPGDAAGSSLWTDYLTTDDEDMRMPPITVEHERHLTAAELATVKLWIDEGGMWNLVADESKLPELPPASMAARVWHFQGLLHPASVHFPIALLTVSAFFVLLSFVRPDTCEPVAFHCLWIGALGGLAASAAGWSYAVHEGYGPSFSFDLFNSAIDRHRWLGIAVSVLAVILIPIAVYVRRTEDFGMRLVWLLGSLLLLAGVSMTGFQGGELTYGEGHYEQEFFKLFPPTATTDDATVETPLPEPVVADSGELTADTPVENPAGPPAEVTVETAPQTPAESAVETPVETAPDTAAEASVVNTAEASVVNTAETPAEPDQQPPADGPTDVPPVASTSAEASSPQASPTEASPTEASSPQASSPQASSPQASPTEASSPQASSPQASPTEASPTETTQIAQDEDDSSQPPPVIQPPALAD